MVNAGYVQQHLGINAAAAQRALRTLVDRDVLAERTGYAQQDLGAFGDPTRWIPTPRTSGEVACRAESVLLVRILR